jgi:hypothetical protein
MPIILLIRSSPVLSCAGADRQTISVHVNCCPQDWIWIKEANRGSPVAFIGKRTTTLEMAEFAKEMDQRTIS